MSDEGIRGQYERVEAILRNGPYLKRTIDADGDHRASSLGANHEPLMAITEGIKDQRDVEHALLLTLEALLNDPTIDQAEVDRLIAKRAGRRYGELPAEGAIGYALRSMPTLSFHRWYHRDELDNPGIRIDHAPTGQSWEAFPIR